MLKLRVFVTFYVSYVSLKNMQQPGSEIQGSASITDEQVIMRCRNDMQAFGVLYERYYRNVFLFVYKRLSDREIAADITSHVFLKAMLNLNGYTFKGVPFGAWLLRIARNELVDHFRKNARMRCVSADTTGLLDFLRDTNEPYSEEHLDLATSELKNLAGDDLWLIELKYFEKRPFAEVAEIMNINEANAKVRAHRIIEKLRIRVQKKMNT
jgi:RNA polymerase sigma-70 factor, ECF subfamily